MRTGIFVRFTVIVNPRKTGMGKRRLPNKDKEETTMKNKKEKLQSE